MAFSGADVLTAVNPMNTKVMSIIVSVHESPESAIIAVSNQRDSHLCQNGTQVQEIDTIGQHISRHQVALSVTTWRLA